VSYAGWEEPKVLGRDEVLEVRIRDGQVRAFRGPAVPIDYWALLAALHGRRGGAVRAPAEAINHCLLLDRPQAEALQEVAAGGQGHMTEAAWTNAKMTVLIDGSQRATRTPRVAATSSST
jgi:hypothetical protein